MVDDSGQRGCRGGDDAVTNESDYKLRSPALVLIRFSFRFLLPRLPPRPSVSHSLGDRSGRANTRFGPPAPPSPSVFLSSFAIMLHSHG
jgi:hypothetical protein